MPFRRIPRPAAVAASVALAAALAGTLVRAGQAPGQAAAAPAAPIAFVNARLIPIAGPVVEKGTLVVQGGKIVAVGRAAVPRGATVVDLAGKVLMPGLVDSHSHVGAVSGADSSAPIQPDVRVLDSLDVRASSIRRAMAGGITTVNVMPGSGHLLSGQTLYLKLRGGTTVDDFLIRLDGGRIAGGLKLANGTNPMRPAAAGPFPGTRAKSAALVREQFVKAVEYREKVRKAAGDPEKMPARDLGMETLVEVLDGTRTIHFHTHRHDDIVTVLRLGKEFGFTPVLQHVSEGWKVADEIAKSGAPCSIIMLDSPGGKLEAMDVALRTGAVLERAGVLTGFHTDDYITDSRLFLRAAGLAVRGGMSRDKALYALTMAGARMLRLESRVGSLEVGKDADFVVLSGDPLSVYTHVEQTWVEGRKVFDRSRPEDRLVAIGGDGATRFEQLHGDEEEDR
jgi:imidazolonepropionase-like amidohydrolase